MSKSNEFGKRLRAWRLQRGLSARKLEMTTGMQSCIVSSIETGLRPASDANIADIASSPDMAIEAERLKAWRDLDKIGGLDGLERLIHYLPGTAAQFLKEQEQLGEQVAQV